MKNMEFQNPATSVENAAAFLARMLPYQMQGLNFEQAGRAVLDRDKALAAATLADDEQGAAIRKGLTVSVFNSVKRA